MRFVGGRNDWPLEPMLKTCIARIVYQHPSVMLACGFKTDGLPQRPPALSGAVQERVSRFNRQHNSGKGETSDADARWGRHEYHYTDQKGRSLIGILAMVRNLSVQVHQELTSISIFCSYICSLSLDDDMHLDRYQILL